MSRVEIRALTQPVGILRIIAIILTGLCFGLAASAGADKSPYWAWCMFTWCFCFFFTLIIVILEFSTVSTTLPFAWEDFTAAFAMLASLMCFAATVMYSIFFTCNVCGRQIGAAAMSSLCFGVYVGEVSFTWKRPSGETRGFLSTVPGIMKMLEAFIHCLIFTSLQTNQYVIHQGMQWCVAVYSLCFIFAILIILVSVAQLTHYIPFSFDMVVIVYNILSALMYMTAMVVWPLYAFKDNGRPANCIHLCDWDKLVMVSIMTILNFIVYTLDTLNSIRLVFFFNQ